MFRGDVAELCWVKKLNDWSHALMGGKDRLAVCGFPLVSGALESSATTIGHQLIPATRCNWHAHLLLSAALHRIGGTMAKCLAHRTPGAQLPE